MSKAINPTFEGDFNFTGLELESGKTIYAVRLHYTLYGKLNEAKDNAILICHALTGSARVADWWTDLIGEGKAFDTKKFCVIGINAIGSCYGSSGPTTLNPLTGKPYRKDFPLVTIGDIVESQAKLIDHLGIEKLHTVAGGSIGGQQAFEWALRFPQKVERCVAIGATELNALGLAFNHLQRQAIQIDPNFQSGNYRHDKQPKDGLSLARAIATCSYKSPELFNERHGRYPNRNGEDPFSAIEERFDVAGYLDYQGESFINRFDANSYIRLSKAMDTFEIARKNELEVKSLERITASLLLIGISSDWLFPDEDVKVLAEKARNAGVNVTYESFLSAQGHDAFLSKAKRLEPFIQKFLETGQESFFQSVNFREYADDNVQYQLAIRNPQSAIYKRGCSLIL